MNYELYHTHPINKAIHFFCIPAIIISSCNLLSIIKVKIYNITFESQELIMFKMLFNYYNISWSAFIVMPSLVVIIPLLVPRNLFPFSSI